MEIFYEEKSTTTNNRREEEEIKNKRGKEGKGRTKKGRFFLKSQGRVGQWK